MDCSRRSHRPLRRAILAMLFVAPPLLPISPATATTEPAPAETQLHENLEVRPLEPGLWLFEAVHVVEPWGPIPSNGLVVGDRGGVIVIDTPWNDELTALLLDWVAERVGPVRQVVATHFHGDRLGGVAEAHRRSIESWGHERTVELAGTIGLEAPRKTFADAVELTTRADGGETIELFYPGAAHTVDNIVAWLPDRGLLYGGCMIKSSRSKSAGNLEDADLEAWPASLRQLQERYPEIDQVIPGHGRAGDASILDHTAGLAAAALAERENAAAP